MRRLRILHISDLHERAPFAEMPREREAKLTWDSEERGYVLGPRFLDALREIASTGIDLVCFTGDLADWGHPNEYAAATARFEAILDAVDVPRERFFAVPGNHDVQRYVQRDAWDGVRRWLADSHDLARLGRWFRQVDRAPHGVTPEWREAILQRTAAFWDWLDGFRGTAVRPRAPKLLGYRHVLPPGTFDGIAVPVHIVGLDSAWLCGADGEQGSIVLTEEQVQAHVRDGAKPIEGLRIGLVHHPLDHLADHHHVRRLLADDGVDVLLHGHQHVPLAITSHEPGAHLHTFAAGCLIEGDVGKNWPNGFQRIDVDPLRKNGATHFMKWSHDGRFWVKGSDLYREAPDGVLAWERDGGVSSPRLVDDAAKVVAFPHLRRHFSPAALLRADSATPVPFRARDQEWQDLTGWCQREEALLLRLYTGAGGMGKTRLMTEACHHLGGTAWIAGFLQSDAAATGDAAWRAALAPGAPRFVVVDYAETRRADVQRLVRCLLEAGGKARIVLLSRFKGDWWEELLRSKDSGDFFASTAIQHLRLGPVAPSVAEREHRFDEALRHFRAVLGVATEPGSHPMPALAHPMFERILVLHMVALAYAEGKVRLDDELAILDYVLQREERFWEALAESRGLPARELRRGLEVAMAAIRLNGGVSAAEARGFISQLPIFGGQPATRLHEIAELLHDAYPGDEPRWIEPLVPDILGEHLALRVLRSGGPDSAFIRARISDA